MKTVKVEFVESVSADLIKTNPPGLVIIAKGENSNNNYTNIRLEPRVYFVPPADGIWEFDMIGEVPPITDGIMAKVTAEYEWKDIPKDIKGIKVYALRNDKVIKL
jgi:hypothetical protein